MIKSDVRLHKDDVDICFSKTLNSCKVPQIRYASVERLLERLTDLRFLSIDFLNTFLHTYRIFTTATVVMDKLADIYKKPFSSIPIRSYNLHIKYVIMPHQPYNTSMLQELHWIVLPPS
ncbi:Ras-specific guanine nucleotide-releasing factor 2 [Goodea atripinnis]|uniref:Ras-specific guanine nucleotide-releasing factor 2 n=1 Tax=Goodea atripinnis TaxID=208336 RepID=A0ABV0MJQ8_9TELE